MKQQILEAAAKIEATGKLVTKNGIIDALNADRATGKIIRDMLKSMSDNGEIVRCEQGSQIWYETVGRKSFATGIVKKVKADETRYGRPYWRVAIRPADHKGATPSFPIFVEDAPYAVGDEVEMVNTSGKWKIVSS